MQLSDYITVLRRRWWVIVLVAAVTAVSAFAFSRLQTPVFRSEATYMVVPNRYDNGLVMVLRGNMSSYRDMALTRDQLARVSSELQLDRSPDWLLRRVTIQPRPDDLTMVVQVDYPQDPATAQLLANAIGTNMVALVGSLNESIEGTDRINLRQMQSASPPILFRPQTRINVLAGAVLGLILGLLLAFLLEALDNTLKSSRDVERFVGLTTLGTIPTTGEGGSKSGGERRTVKDRPSALQGRT